MADKEEKPKGGPGFLEKSWVATSNVTKTLYNLLRGKPKLHYRKIGKMAPHTIKRLRFMRNYIDLLRRRLEELWIIETRSTNQDKTKKQIEEAYLKTGPYDERTVDTEYRLFKHGHPIGPDGANTYGEALFGKKLVYEVEGIEIARPEFGKLPSFKFPLPKKFEIMYPMGFPEYVSAYGKENDAQWLEAYEGFVDHMCDDMYINMMDYVFKKERQSLPQIERYFKVREAVNEKLKKWEELKKEKMKEWENLTEKDRAVKWKALMTDKRNPIKDKETLENYRIYLKKKIENIAEQNPEIKKKSDVLKQNVYLIVGAAAKEVFKVILNEHIIPMEQKFYGFLKGMGEEDSVSKYVQKLKTLRTNMLKDVPEKIRHKHTYYIIKRLTDEEQNRLESVIPLRKRIGETLVGLDENLMPLEVAGPGGYTYNKEHYPEGTILIDIWDATDETDFEENKITKAEIRQAPKEYITEVDVLDTAVYLHNEWDEYRDDLRDARYHPHSMLAIDYAMALNSDIKKEWKKGWDSRREVFAPFSKEKWRQYKMVLGDGDIKEDTRRATNLSPAFDKRAWKIPGQEWEYIGKRYYYDTVIMSTKYYKWDQKDPIITTRGLSHYIIQKVIREMKYYDQAHEALLEISNATGGYDYGPRRFYKPFNRDPFNIDLTEVNKELPSPEEDWKKGAGRDGE